jgi:isoquinoline 1-oxidoreductase alpha subunit
VRPGQPRRFDLTVNGRQRSVKAELGMPLLWVLRDRLGLLGTRYGCGLGVCGACTVLEGSRAVRSCQLAIEDAADRSFTTIEGLSSDGSHPVQRAWLEEDVAQCGYCQSGLILETVALLAAHPEPSDREIDRALGDVLCRCGTYVRVRRAVRRAAELAREPAR